MAQQYVSEGTAYYTEVLDGYLSGQGVTPEQLPQFYGWLQAGKAPELRHALQQFVLGRDPQVFGKLATEWQIAKKLGRG